MQRRARTSPPRSCLPTVSPRAVDAPGSLPPPLKHQHGRRRAFSSSRAKESQRASLPKFTVLDPSQAKLSTPQHSPHPCELSAPPSSPSNSLNRRSSPVFSNSSRDRRRGALPVATVFQSVSRLSSDRFKFLSCSSCSCARSFSLDVNRSTGTASPDPEHPPDRTATVAKPFYCFSRCGEVSTMLPASSRTSRTRWFTLYRALVAGLWSAVAAAHLSRGRSGGRR